MNLKILVTGSNGQLGKEIIDIARFKTEYNFVFTDIEELDIANVEQLTDMFEIHNPNFVVNCAAYTAVDAAETDIDNAFRINSAAVCNLAVICQKHQIPIIHLSTDYVFDGQNYRPYREDDATNPQNVYGKSKLEGEEALKDYNKAMIIRTSWLYSAYGNNFVKTILKLIKEKPLISVVFDQIGTPTYAQDLAIAIFEIIHKYYINKEFIGGIYHFSNEGVCSWYDFAMEIAKLNNSKCEIVPVTSEQFPRPAKRPFYSVLDKSKIKENYAIKIAHWTESLKKCIFTINKMSEL